MGKTEPYTEQEKEDHNIAAAFATRAAPERFVWRHQYDDLRDALEGDLIALDFPEPSLTQQHFAKDADLNTIVKRYGITDGAIPVTPLDPQFFGDFTNAPEDFRTVLEISKRAKDHFMALPADMRTAFHNDPAELHDWVTNPANKEEAISLGLLPKEPKQKDTRPIAVQRKAELEDWAAKNSEEAHRLGIKKDAEKKPASK